MMREEEKFREGESTDNPAEADDSERVTVGSGESERETAVAGRRRRRLLVDRKLQMSYVGIYLGTSAMFLIAFFLLNLIFLFLHKRMLLKYSHFPRIEGDLLFVLVINVVMVVLIAMAMALYSIIHSHRVAGPTIRLKQCIEKLMAGDHDFHLTFREKDFLHDLAEGMNELNQTMKEEDEVLAGLAAKLGELRRDLQKDDRFREKAAELARIEECIADLGKGKRVRSEDPAGGEAAEEL
jgi:hypothetical protein